MSTLTIRRDFSELASEEQIERAVASLKGNGIQAVVVENGEEARRKVLELIPEGAEVFNATSRTLDSIGLTQAIEKSTRFRPLRPEMMKLDWQTQMKAMKGLTGAPDVVVGSVHAVTEKGEVLIASATGSQLGMYVYGASKVIWVAGTQKIVPSLEDGVSRIYEYTLPLEDARARQVYGMGSGMHKLLTINREVTPGRIMLVLVKEKLGF